MAFPKMTKNVLNISALDNKPSCSATELKGFFDQAGKDIKDFINTLIDLIASETAAGNIGVNLESVATKNLQAVLETFEKLIADKYSKNESNALVAEETNNLIADFNIELSTGIVTVTRKDGTVETYDTAMEKVPATFRLIEENEVYYLEIINVDGTSSRINVNNLFNEYLFTNSDEISFEVVEEGNRKKVVAKIRDNSIGIGKLSLDLITQLENYVRSASSSATSASTSANTATQKATEASESASSAKESENTAIEKAGLATSEAALAKSYAVGGTGTREGEDTDNAKFYYEQVKGALPENLVTRAELEAAITEIENNKADSDEIPKNTSDLKNDSNFISSTTVTSFWSGTQAAYDALGTYEETTLYLIDEEEG